MFSANLIKDMLIDNNIKAVARQVGISYPTMRLLSEHGIASDATRGLLTVFLQRRLDLWGCQLINSSNATSTKTQPAIVKNNEPEQYVNPFTERVYPMPDKCWGKWRLTRGYFDVIPGQPDYDPFLDPYIKIYSDDSVVVGGHDESFFKGHSYNWDRYGVKVNDFTNLHKLQTAEEVMNWTIYTKFIKATNAIAARNGTVSTHKIAQAPDNYTDIEDSNSITPADIRRYAKHPNMIPLDPTYTSNIMRIMAQNVYRVENGLGVVEYLLDDPLESVD